MARRPGVLTDPRTGEALPPRADPGYYPEFHTLEQQNFWDAATRQVVLGRVAEPPPIRFFTKEERQTAEAVFERVLPQDDRPSERRIPIVPIVDDRLYHRRLPGYRYEDMPEDPEAMRAVLHNIDAMAREVCGARFHELDVADQERLLLSLRDRAPLGGDARWASVPVDHAWSLLVDDAVDAYYAHPWAWDEVGFGGPAYPRGYMRLENGAREPWEVDEVRYEWEAPEGTLSDAYRPLEDAVRSGRHRGGPA
jgi:hypothetical protein